MEYIIRMSMQWKDKLENKENITFFNENNEDNTIDIKVEDIDTFTSKNNFYIEYEILMPGLIKLGLIVVGIILYPNFRDEKIENLMLEMFKRQRKYGVKMRMHIQSYNDSEKMLALPERTNENGSKVAEHLEEMWQRINK